MSGENTSTGLKGLLGRIAPQLLGKPDNVESIPDTSTPDPRTHQDITQTNEAGASSATKPAARLVTFGGISCVCNLEWTSAQESRFTLSNPRGLAKITWSNRTAIATGPEFEGQPALLQLAASTLTAADCSGAVLIVISFPERDLWFSAVLVDGKPALEQEHLFTKKSDLIRHVSALANSPAIARVFCSSDVIEDFSLVEPAKPFEVPQLDPRDFSSFKRSTPILTKPVAIALGSVFGVLGVVVITKNIFLPLIFPAPPLQSDTPMMSYVEDYGVFAQGCEAAFATPWPTAPGWSLEREGCATKGMNDPEVNTALKEPAAAYQVFALKGQHNAILARRAAELIYADYPHQAVVDRGKLMIFKPFPITLLERPDLHNRETATKPAIPQGSLLHRAEDAFLGIEAGIKANGGSLAGKALPKVDITTPASLAEVLRRIARLDKVSLARLHRKNGVIDITLTSPRIILRPMQTTSEGNS